jgi:D-xylose transport system permease protein
MAEVAETAPEGAAGGQTRRNPLVAGLARLGDLVRQTEINLRLFGMVVALLAILLAFGIQTNGRFLAPENIVALSIQSATIAIIATGMVLIIVSRNIDLSVGSIVGVVAMAYAILMSDVFPQFIGSDHPLEWVFALIIGIALGAALGGFQGFIIAYIGVPSFVVTLGGLLAFRGLVWVMSGGPTVSGIDPTFVLLGGGPRGSLGGTMSWVVGVIAAIAIVGLLLYNRRQRQRYGFPLRPRWAEILLGGVGIAVVLGLVAYTNSYLWPPGLVAQYAADRGISPVGLRIESGIPWPIVIVIGVAIIVHFIATRLQFGRSVFAYGGNPDAAELAGINTRATIMKTFILMGILCAIAAAVASARLNGATLDVGSSYELYVIAAAVIGGTSFAGGIGTVPGAILGALVMQSLAYGLSFIGLSSPYQDIAAGAVLVLAVAFDSWNRRRSS